MGSTLSAEWRNAGDVDDTQRRVQRHERRLRRRSPRFQINIGGKNLFIYFGPTPSFSGCPTGWTDTGNLIGSTDARFDLTQLGGPFYGTYADALALVGAQPITGIQLVVDGGWSQPDKEQTVLVRKVTINDQS